jgi:PAS domain S-box-containing protein
MLDASHLTSLFENATEGIILTKGRGPIVLVNPAAERMFGYSSEELIGQAIEILIPDRFNAHHKELRDKYVAHPQNRNMGAGRDLYGKKKNNTEFPVEVSLSFYSKDNEMFVIAFIVDITRRKRVEEENYQQQIKLERMARSLKEMNADLERKVQERTLILREALQKLEEAQKETYESLKKEQQLNEIKSRFISIASHEFRTPLSTVLSSASLLGKYTTTEEQNKRERHIEKIRNSVKTLNNILEDFLSLGKLEEGKVNIHGETFNARQFVHAIIEDLQDIKKPGQEFIASYSGDSTITADKRILKNILLNLLSNAIKFSKEGDPIKLDIGVEDNQFTVSVSDQGIGIPKEDLEQLFSSFFRARNASNIQGTGLGLHIVKRYVDLMGGTIQVNSVLGQGTSFVIRLKQMKPGEIRLYDA